MCICFGMLFLMASSLLSSSSSSSWFHILWFCFFFMSSIYKRFWGKIIWVQSNSIDDSFFFLFRMHTKFPFFSFTQTQTHSLLTYFYLESDLRQPHTEPKNSSLRVYLIPSTSNAKYSKHMDRLSLSLSLFVSFSVSNSLVPHRMN